MNTFFLSPDRYETLKGRYAKFNEPWTDDETDELRRMAADGVPRADMSRQLGRSPNAVKMKLRSLGLYVPKPAGRPWSADDDASLVRRYLAGASFATLASAFNRTENAVIARLVRLRAGRRTAPGAPDVPRPPALRVRSPLSSTAL